MSSIHTPSHTPVSVVLVHGVGMSPSLFDGVVDAVGARARVSVPLRRGYRPGARPTGFDDLVGDLRDEVQRLGPSVVAGVSGGATLALGLAVAGCPNLMGVVAHEPLVGPLAGDLHAAVVQRAGQLARSVDAGGAVEFVAALVGADVWSALPPWAAEFVVAHADAVRSEVPWFVGFAPTKDQLATIDVPTVVTTGARSNAARHHAAHVVAEASAATALTIAGSGHLACWEQPGGFAVVIERCLPLVVEDR